MAKTKKVAFLPPALGYPFIAGAGYLTSKAVEKLMDKKGDDAKLKKIHHQKKYNYRKLMMLRLKNCRK